MTIMQFLFGVFGIYCELLFVFHYAGSAEVL